MWQKLYRSIWKDLSSTFKQLSKSLDAHTSFLETCSARLQDTSNPYYDSAYESTPHQRPVESVCTGREFSRYRSDIKLAWEDFKNQETKRKTKQRARIKTWISSSNTIADKHRQFQETRQLCPRSGRWLLRSYAQLNYWMRDEEPPESAVWLHGNMGFGTNSCISRCQATLR